MNETGDIFFPLLFRAVHKLLVISDILFSERETYSCVLLGGFNSVIAGVPSFAIFSGSSKKKKLKAFESSMAGSAVKTNSIVVI